MTAKAILTEADAKRLAKVAKSQGVSVRIARGDFEITFSPLTVIKDDKDNNSPPKDLAL